MTKKIFIIILTIIFLTSCSEEFRTIDPTDFNKKITNRTDIKTAEQLIEIYYDYPTNEGIPQLEIEKRELEDNKVEISLIHDRQQDDSQRATKIILTAERNGEAWTILEIKENWKCYDGRGHTDWGIELCN